MTELSKESNRIFIAGKEVLTDWEPDKALQKVRTLLKNYLELDNVSFLFGAGSSIILGSISIASVPNRFVTAIKQIQNKDGKSGTEAFQEFEALVVKLQGTKKLRMVTWTDGMGVVRETDSIDYPLEKLLNTLTALDFIQLQAPNIVTNKYVKETIDAIKGELFSICDLEKLSLNEDKLTDDQTSILKQNKFFYHEKFTKKALQRPLNLKRCCVFTTNYDLAFDLAFDRLGIHYINGFNGFHKRTFRPETYEYDLFYPGSTTQGRVTRIEKVLKYYKIHGSLTWVDTEAAADNVYGIEEWPIELVREKRNFPRLMIYPSSVKKSYTLDFPYSELFRQFAATITQAQSVLITFGYSFSDEHINDIIYQALTIPSFTLIIIDFNGTSNNKEISRLNSFNDPRVIILEGKDIGNFPFFVEQVMPDFIEENAHEKIAETLKSIYEPRSELLTTPEVPELKEAKVENSDEAEDKKKQAASAEEDLPF